MKLSVNGLRPEHKFRHWHPVNALNLSLRPVVSQIRAHRRRRFSNLSLGTHGPPTQHQYSFKITTVHVTRGSPVAQPLLAVLLRPLVRAMPPLTVGAQSPEIEISQQQHRPFEFFWSLHNKVKIQTAPSISRLSAGGAVLVSPGRKACVLMSAQQQAPEGRQRFLATISPANRGPRPPPFENFLPKCYKFTFCCGPILAYTGYPAMPERGSGQGFRKRFKTFRVPSHQGSPSLTGKASRADRNLAKLPGNSW